MKSGGFCDGVEPNDAEWLVSVKMGLQLEQNSKKGYDAFNSKDGLRYQVKSRWGRGVPSAQSRELNVIRDYDDKQFDYLIVIIFDEHFDVKEAYLIPHDAIRNYARYSKYQNGYILVAMGAVLSDRRVVNITTSF